MDELFTRGGEMAERVRAYDWATNPLGPLETWPQSLKTTVRIMLNSRYPMFVWWAEGLINLYNDAYVSVLGKRHPQALGKSARSVWAEIWDIVGAQADIVLHEGRATWNDEVLLVMERNGFTEETYFTWSYSPVTDDDGRISGVFCTCQEETAKVVGKRRLKTLRDLGERALEKSKTAEDACRAAAESLAENAYDIPFALIYLLNETAQRAVLMQAVGLERGTQAAPESVELGGTADVWHFADALHGKNARLHHDFVARFGSVRW